MALTIADRLQIQQSINAYCHLVDYGEPEAMRALFTADMEFAVTATGQLFRGIGEFIEFLASRRGTRDRVRHLIANIVIHEEGSMVSTQAYLQIVKLEQGVSHTVKLTRYQDEWICDGGVWRISRRRIED